MKQRYVIIGTRRFGDNVRLNLKKQEVVEKVEELDVFSIASNPQRMINKMETKALLSQQPDTITISYEEWDLYKYKIDDVIIVNVEPENNMEKEK